MTQCQDGNQADDRGPGHPPPGGQAPGPAALYGPGLEGPARAISLGRRPGRWRASPPPPIKEATARLDTSGLPFVLFADRRAGRGNVVHHRCDGHYGLITPSG
ncbi:sigma 54 modulation/S30EA ribosomal C-terminal domain-containing protein [Microbispora bryophytorum]